MHKCDTRDRQRMTPIEACVCVCLKQHFSKKHHQPFTVVPLIISRKDGVFWDQFVAPRQNGLNQIGGRIWFNSKPKARCVGTKRVTGIRRHNPRGIDKSHAFAQSSSFCVGWKKVLSFSQKAYAPHTPNQELAGSACTLDASSLVRETVS